jgi:hypothetical protein
MATSDTHPRAILTSSGIPRMPTGGRNTATTPRTAATTRPRRMTATPGMGVTTSTPGTTRRCSGGASG